MFPLTDTVVGIPGRIVHRSGVRVNPLEHGNLPDSEGRVIRLLLKRIEDLEKQVEELLRTEKAEQKILFNGGESELPLEKNHIHEKSCRLIDKEIEEFLGGTM